MKLLEDSSGTGRRLPNRVTTYPISLACFTVSSDAVGRKLQKKGTKCFDAIVESFGTEILDEKGELDRDKLAGIVFSDSARREELNGMLLPLAMLHSLIISSALPTNLP